MTKPLIINVCGVPKIGISSICDRVERALTASGLTVKTLALRSLKQVFDFNDDMVLDVYKNTDVILLDNHQYTTQALRSKHKDIKFGDDDVKPDFAFVVTAKLDDYLAMLDMADLPYQKKRQYAALMDAYLLAHAEQLGSGRIYRYRLTSRGDILFASGSLRQIIINELKRG